MSAENPQITEEQVKEFLHGLEVSYGIPIKKDRSQLEPLPFPEAPRELTEDERAMLTPENVQGFLGGLKRSYPILNED